MLCRSMRRGITVRKRKGAVAPLTLLTGLSTLRDSFRRRLQDLKIYKMNLANQENPVILSKVIT